MGVISIIVSYIIVYVYLIEPIKEAQAGAQMVTTSVMRTFAGLLIGVLGVFYLIGGARFARIFHPVDGESKLPIYLIGGVIGVISIVAYSMLVSYLHKLGYTF
jgi:hypothetical protein